MNPSIQQDKSVAQPRLNPHVVVEPPKRNRFYALKGREEQKKSTDVDNYKLLVFSFTVYALLDPGSTLYMVTPLVANTFDLLLEMLHKSFLVSPPIQDNVMVEGVCREVDNIVESTFEIKLGVARFKS